MTDLDQVAEQWAALQVLNRAARAIDQATPTDWLDCYADDGVFRYRAVGGTEDVFRLAGHAELTSWFAEHRKRMPAGTQAHLLLNPALVPDGDRIRATCTYLTLSTATGQLAPMSCGLWEDVLVKGADGNWRIADRCAYRLMPA